MSEEVDFGWFYALAALFLGVLVLNAALIGYHWSGYDVEAPRPAPVAHEVAAR